MCGIIGYIGEGNAGRILLEGLKRLEYRGYDSCGMAVLGSNGLQVRKDRGRIEEIDKTLDFCSLGGKVGIAHNRWATHGEPSTVNAHPHFDCRKQIAIVHNGIIENHETLRNMLVLEGHKMESGTDSEVIAHLIEKFYKGNLENSVIKALEHVEGTYGLAVIKEGEEKVVAARNGSPLVVGVGRGEMLVASDISAILGHTKDVIYLEDGEVAVLAKGSYSIRNMKNKEIHRETEKVKWTLEEIEKKGFKHFMLKEILEQPESIKNTLAGRIRDGVKLTLDIRKEDVKRIIITACGTSWHAGLIGRHLLENISGIQTEVDYASEFRYRNPLLDRNTLVVVVSQSGETADTLAALRLARQKGAMTLGIVNVVGSTIAREAGTGIYQHAGPEIGVASTKAFTSQVASLLLLAFYLKSQLAEEDVKLLRELEEMPANVRRAFSCGEHVFTIAKEFAGSRNFLYLGRGLNFPVALEGALKLKEISYIHAEGYPAAEMKHGPIALIDKDMPVVFIASQGQGYEKILSNMEEVKARGGRIIAVATEGDERIRRLAEHVIYVPQVREELSPMINVIPLQLLAYYIADLKGLDCDHPRNLAKAITVE